jgi:hypothetical protein
MGRADPTGARIRVALTTLSVLALGVLLAERAGYAGLYEGKATSGGIAAQLALAVPSLFYLGALWQLRMVAARTSAGEPFAAAVATGLRRAGVMLVTGAALTLFAVPVLHRMFELAVPRLIEADVSTLIVGAIGIAMFLIARLIDRARAVQGELDAIF